MLRPVVPQPLGHAVAPPGAGAVLRPVAAEGGGLAVLAALVMRRTIRCTIAGAATPRRVPLGTVGHLAGGAARTGRNMSDTLEPRETRSAVRLLEGDEEYPLATRSPPRRVAHRRSTTDPQPATLAVDEEDGHEIDTARIPNLSQPPISRFLSAEVASERWVVEKRSVFRASDDCDPAARRSSSSHRTRVGHHWLCDPDNWRNSHSPAAPGCARRERSDVRSSAAPHDDDCQIASAVARHRCPWCVPPSSCWCGTRGIRDARV